MGKKIQERSAPAITFSVSDAEMPAETSLDEIQNQSHEGPSLRRRLRPFVEPFLFLALVGATIVAVDVGGGRDAPDVHTTPQAVGRAPTALPSTSGSSSPQPTPVVVSHLIMPGTARPGEAVVVVGYRTSTLCGSLELRFDDAPIVHRVQAVGSTRLGQSEIYMTMNVPSTATAGAHHVKLVGPVPGAAGGSVCGEAPEHQDVVAAADILVDA